MEEERSRGQGAAAGPAAMSAEACGAGGRRAAMLPAPDEAARRATTAPADPGAAGWRAEVAFLRRVLIVAAVVVLLLLLWQMRGALLLVFAAIVVAVVLLAAARPFERHLGMGRRWSLVLAGGLILLGLGVAVILIGSEVETQFTQLRDRLPQAVRAFEQRFSIDVPMLGGSPDTGAQQAAGDTTSETIERIAGHIAAFGRSVFDVLSALVLAVVGGAFLAADPRLHRQGLVMLLPRSQHARAEDVLVTAGRALRLWLAGTVLAMVVIGAAVGLGTWAIGLPAPLALGLFAGLTEFVPILGPVIGAVPALLLALSQGGDALLWTLGLFIVVQQVESNLITPLTQERMARIPSAVLLFAVVAVGAVFGLPGVMLAAPLTVVIYVAVQKLYVRQTLGEHDAEVPGEKEPPPR